MSVFEFIMVMVSVILALALAQLLRALTEIPTNAEPYWVHSAWVGVIAFIVIQTWWGYWDLTHVETWTFLSYLIVLFIPVAWFVLAHLLVPVARNQDTDWRAHFFQVARWFFLFFCLSTIVATLMTWTLLGAPLLHPYRAFQATSAVILLTGAFVSSHRSHSWLLVLLITVMLAGQVVIRMNLGALAAK